MKKHIVRGLIAVTSGLVALWLPIIAAAAPREKAPDMGKILFVSSRDGNPEVYVMNADGTNATNLTDDPSSDTSPAWSPNGKKVAFVSDRDGNSEIYLMNANGAGKRNLTKSPGSDSGPVWSPDGRKIAFVSDRDGNGEVYIMNSNGTGQANISNCESTDRAPTWSPDSDRIAFESNRDGRFQIYIWAENGSGITELTDSAQGSLFPAWSPTANTIAFMTVGLEGIVLVEADGTNLRCPRGYGGDQHGPLVWSSDGSKLAYEEQSMHGQYHVIRIMNADGTPFSSIHDPNPVPYDYSGQASFSPDGTRVAFVRNDVWVWNSKNNAQDNLTKDNIPSYESQPAWSP